MRIILDNITKIYSGNSVLKNVNLIFDSGTYGVIGKNGAGKTTLFNSITKYITPTRGGILYNGETYIIDLPQSIKLEMGYLSSVNSLFEMFSVKEYLEYSSKLFKVSKEDARQRINELLDLFFKEQNTDTLVKDLSTGNRKKLELCSCIIHKPSFLILDEPFSGLDPIASKQLISFINKYGENKKRTILISSHNLNHIEKIINHLIILDDGKVVLDSSIIDIKESSNYNLDELLSTHVDNGISNTELELNEKSSIWS